MKSWKINLITILCIAVLFLALQLSNAGVFADPDGFYHAKASQLLVSGKLTENFPWMQFTTWKDGYADQHYLYHWLLTPFNSVDHLQWSIVVFAALFLLVFYFLFKKFKIPAISLWFALMLGGSIDFLFRLNLVKANTLSLTFLAALSWLLYAWHESKDSKKSNKIILGILLVSGLFVWLYGGFVFAPFFILAYCVAASIDQRKIVIAPLLASLCGIAIAFVLHPHSTNFASLMYDQLIQTGLGAGKEVPVGGEWLPFGIEWFFRSNLIIVFVWVIGVIVELSKIRSKTKIGWLNLWMYATSLGLLVLTFWHRRFIEYWVPFAVLSAAVTLAPYLSGVTREKIFQAWKSFWQFRLVSVCLVIFLIITVSNNIKNVNNYLAAGYNSNFYKSSAEWMNSHSQTGEIVFNTQWDQFPGLFYWNDSNYYLVGLDPTFMYLHNRDLYFKWRTIADDNPTDWTDSKIVYDILKTDFKTKFVFADNNRNSDIVEFMNTHPEYFEFGTADGNLRVYIVK